MSTMERRVAGIIKRTQRIKEKEASFKNDSGTKTKVITDLYKIKKNVYTRRNGSH